MTTIDRAGARVLPLAGRSNAMSFRQAAACSPVRRRLDRDSLRSGVVARQRQLAELEMDMVAACEQAAARHAAACVRIDDRETWDWPTWERYLAAAADLEPDYGPPMRRLLEEIDQLGRLMALPLAA